MSDEVDILNRMKKTAYQKNMIQLKQEVAIVKHELIIEYGEENTFASNAPDHTTAQSYTYTSIQSTGSSPAVLRSEWTPRVSSLQDICANPALAEQRNSSALTNGFVLSEKCSHGAALNPNLQKHQYFTGAVPPQDFRTFRAKPEFSANDTLGKKAYQKLLDFLATCQTFDKAVDFLKHLDQSMTDNVISPKEISDLTVEYKSVKDLLQSSYIQSILDKKAQGVQGVDALKRALKL